MSKFRLYFHTLPSTDHIYLIRFHWKSLLQDVSALSSTINLIKPSTTSLSPLIEGPTILEGIQIVSKFNLPASQADQVKVYMALWRIQSKLADLVLTINVPLGKVGEEISQENRILEKQVGEIFRIAVESLEIKDLGLFA